MEKKKNSIWQNYKFPIILLGSIVLGSIIGLVLGEKATVLKTLGDIFLNLMFTIVVPLVFLTITSAVSDMVDMKRLGKIISSMLLVFIITGIIASIVMIGTVKMFPPAQNVKIDLQMGEAVEPLSTGEQIVAALTVTDFPLLISRKNMLPLILLSIFFGICVSLLGDKGKKISEGLDLLSQVFLKMVSLVMYYAPIGLGAYFAALIGDFGPDLLVDYCQCEYN